MAKTLTFHIEYAREDTTITIYEERNFHAQYGRVAPISKKDIELKGGGFEYYICHKEKATTLKIQYGEDAFLRLN